MNGKLNPRPGARRWMTALDPEDVAIRTLARLAADPDRMDRFLATTGLAPETIRVAASSPEFLIGVLDHVMADEDLLSALASETGLDPTEFGLARARLSPDPPEA